MTARFLASLALLASLTSGCIIHDNDSDCEGDCGGGGGGGGTQLAGDVSFGWTFAGMSCAEVSDVKSVRIHIPGETLQNDGIYPCQASGTAGIVLHDFVPGSYSFSVEARGYDGELYYESSGTFRVNGDVHVDVDLAPAADASSYAYLSWSFPSVDGYTYPSCAQAVPGVYGGITHVDVYLDGSFWKTFACEDGHGSYAVTTPYLSVGTHEVELVASGAGGYVYHRFSGSLSTYAGRPVAVDYKLAWAVGGTLVKWKLYDGASEKTCAEAGIEKVAINFQDEDGHWLYDWDSPSVAYACTDAPIAFDYLPPGVLTVHIDKWSGPGLYDYRSDAYDPMTVGIRAGEWPSGVVSVPLYRY